MARRSRQFHSWGDHLTPGLRQIRALRMAVIVLAAVLVVLVAGAPILWNVLRPPPPPVATVELHLQPVQSEPVPVFSAASSTVWPGSASTSRPSMFRVMFPRITSQ